MSIVIPLEGAASMFLCREVHKWWMEAASNAGIELSGFNPEAPIGERIAWATSMGLEISGSLARYSTKMQHSTETQLQQNVGWAAKFAMYVVPEYVCIDEAEKGRKQRRSGLERMKFILKNKLIAVLLVYKVSRLLRVGYKGFEFIQEDVVEEGLRAVSVSQGIDTADADRWKALLYLHGLMDDMLLDTIADHCRAGLQSLFLQGYVTGAIPVGYRRQEVPGAPPTNRGLPRTCPVVDEQVAALIREHYEMIRDGMGIAEGWRRWLAAGGPCDPRATTGAMSYPPYRGLLSNPRYTGLWAFGRMKNVWSNKRDGNRQVEQPESEVKLLRSDELRIIDDELYIAVQQRLAKHATGPRGPRKKKAHHLWDLVTGMFYCAACSTEGNLVRFYQTGARGSGMQCKNGHQCPAQSAVRREEAVKAVCLKLQELVTADAEFVQEVLCQATVLDAAGDEALSAQIDKTKAGLAALARRIEDLHELLGAGSEEDRRETKARIRAAQADKQARQLELHQLEGSRERDANPITREEVQQALANMVELLDNAGSGSLGQDVVYKARAVFEALVGGVIMVHVEARASRKQTIVRGVFRPDLVGAAQAAANTHMVGEAPVVDEVEVWLRKPPFIDLWARRAFEICDLEGHSYRSAAKVFNSVHGLKINSGKLWQLRQRYYQMLGQPVPPLSYNNGRRRKSA